MQKKLVLAAAVAGALAAPAAFAEATIYGHLDIGVQLLDAGDGYNGSETFVTDQQGSGGSLVGWRASEDIGGGLTGLAVIEVGFFTDTGSFDNSANQFAQRQVYAGLSGGFGTVTAGRQYREVFLVGGGAAYNYTSSGIGVFFLNSGTGVRQSDFIKYTTPSLGGISIVAGYAPGEGTDPGGADDEDGQYTELAAKYSAGPLRAGLAFGTSTAEAGGTPVDTDIVSAGGQYSFGPTTVYALFTSAEEDGGTEVSAISLGVKQTVGSGDVVLQVGQRSDDTAGATDADSTLIGLAYFHKLSKTTQVYATLGNVDNDTNAALPAPRQRGNVGAAGINNPGEDPRTISFGIRRNF